MRNMMAVFRKQLTDTRKNKVLLLQFVMIPVICLVMNHMVQEEELGPRFFTQMFAPMFVGMCPLVAASSVVSEEKEKGTLRALRMAGVRSAEYLIGVGSQILIVCMLGCLVMAFDGGYTGTDAALFLLWCLLGICVSVMIGFSVGVASRSQMNANAIAMPVMMAFSFLPMISMFNETVDRFARFTYTYQVMKLVAVPDASSLKALDIGILCGNAALVLGLFVWLYRKKGLE